jgi:glycerophosphoryl diester phosphodiesterase
MIIGRRGVKGDVMENTLESILHSIDLGVDGIEIDIQRCYTGEIVLFHDETLYRLAFKDQFYFGNTINVPISKLQWYHLYNTELIDSLGRKYKIPKLIDVLRHPKVYRSDILINIEIKDYRSHESVADMISELVDEGLYDPGRFLISSYLTDPLIYFEEFKADCLIKEQKYQNFKIGWIIEPDKLSEKDFLFSTKSYLKVLTHVILDKDMLNLSLIEKIKEMGLRIFVHTINNKNEYPIDDIHNLVDGIITDKPKNFICKN